MYKLRVLGDFGYKKYDNLVEIISKDKKVKGMLFKNDEIISKDKEEVDYLLGNNPIKMVACEFLEEIIETELEEKPKKKKANKEVELDDEVLF